ncbi:hypothetical protein J4221_01385 [Candidatus Pacearchaeota archaeon]|nr:hypothetical protein [Candidatus Pacearchaeota archaeon]
MAKKRARVNNSVDLISSLVNVALWLTGIIVSLSVGFAMTDGTLSLPRWLGGSLIAMLAGWIVIVLTLLSVLLAIFGKLR